jgi:fluoride exporter
VTRGDDAHPRALQWSDRLPLDPDVDATVDDAAHHRRVVLLVFAGGCLGGLVRYLTVRHWPELATEVLTGSRYLRPLLGAGFCGALTTFSSIVVSVDRLAAHGHAGLAVGYLAATVAAGLAAGAAGLAATRLAARRC